jgi:hypothetical protein
MRWNKVVFCINIKQKGARVFNGLFTGCLVPVELHFETKQQNLEKEGT